MKRNFNEWFKTFRTCINDYGYYCDFPKVYQNIESIKVELNILNSLIGSKNIEDDFENLVLKYPQVLKCIPILLAVRMNEIYVRDNDGEFLFNFNSPNYSIKEYKFFMRKIGLFTLLQEHLISNLIDYATGVEVGLDLNARKNRGGHLMENLVESYLIGAGLQKDSNYFKEIYLSQIEKMWSLDLSKISNNGKTDKRFDFVVYKNSKVYAIETNFYSSSGSKLNETARSYKQIALESKNIDRFEFIWFTDGQGWNSAKHNLEETFDCLDNLYCINDLENGIASKLFNQG